MAPLTAHPGKPEVKNTCLPQAYTVGEDVHLRIALPPSLEDFRRHPLQGIPIDEARQSVSGGAPALAGSVGHWAAATRSSPAPAQAAWHAA